MTKKTYTLCCHRCDAQAILGPAVCPKCGPSNLIIQSQSDRPDFDHQAVFQCCHGISSQTSTLPKRCVSCGSRDLGWKHLSTSTWHDKEFLVESEMSGVWISADFDGDYFGKTNDSTVQLSRSIATDVKIIGGELRNIVKIAQPPKSRGESTEAPFLQDKVSNLAFIYDERSGPLNSYHGSLIHFQLHDWQKISNTSSQGDASVLNGRIVGKAYGQLIEPEKEKQKEWEEPKYLPDASKATSFVESIKQTASTWIAPVVKQLTNQLSGNTTASNLNSMNQGGQNSPPIMPGTTCRHCSFFLMLIAFIAVWAVCSLNRAFIAELPLVILCILGLFQRQNGSFLINLNKGWQILLGLFLLMAAVALLFFFGYQDRAHAECSTTLPWWIISIGFILVLTIFIDICWLWVVIALIWVYALLFQCSVAEEVCRARNVIVKPAPPVVNPPPNVNKKDEIVQNIIDQTVIFKKKIENTIEDITTKKVDERIVTETDKGGRITLNKALSDPDKYFSCGAPNSNKPIYDVYIGGDALFPFDSAQIKDGALNLTKLVELIQKAPNSKIIITGHSDLIGSSQAKLVRSMDRAQSVATWLVTNGVVPSDNIQVRGRADSDPIVTTPQDKFQELNRRVEIRLDCR